MSKLYSRPHARCLAVLAPTLLCWSVISVDSSVAVRETLNKENDLAHAFIELLPIIPQRMHKLDAVRDVFNTHKPQKAIVFVDRVVIPSKLSEFFTGNPKTNELISDKRWTSRLPYIRLKAAFHSSGAIFCFKFLPSSLFL